MKKIVSALLLLLCMVCAAALAEVSGDYEYVVLEDGTAQITDYHGRGGELTVPTALDGHAVSAIGKEAFWGDELTKVTIPDSITTMDANPFPECEYLAEFIVSPGHPTLYVIDGVLFGKADKRLISYPAAKTDTSYAIPQGTGIIGDYAFDSCGSLTDVTIPDGVTVIGKLAFYNCSSMAKVSIPDSVTVIGNSAFSRCNSLTGVTIPGSVTAIGDTAFFDCISLTSVTIPDSVTTIGENPFLSCKALHTVSVSPEHPALAVIDGVLFSKADKRLVWYSPVRADAAYDIPAGVEVIGESAFAYCPWLTAVGIPDSVTVIGQSAFEDCAGLTGIRIPEGVTVIGKRAFMRCSSLADVSIPGSVTAIGSHAFYGCGKLTGISLPAGIAAISQDMFTGCESLTAITIPDSVTAIGDYAFEGCKGLTAITIPDSVTSLGEGAFYRCDGLTSVTIPDSVTTFGGNPFRGCKALETIVVSPGHPTLTVMDGLLVGKADMRLVWYPIPRQDAGFVVPDYIRIIGDYAFDSCRLTSVSIPDGVTAIGTNAFFNCTNLTGVSIPASVTAMGDPVFYVHFMQQPTLIQPGGAGQNMMVYGLGYSVTVTVERDSFAEQYCMAHRVPYIYADGI